MTRPGTGSTFDKVVRWIVFILAVLGGALYALGVVTEWQRLSRNIREDGIVLGFVYTWLTALGVLRAITPRIPRLFSYTGALVNALVGAVLVMLWVGLFTGALDRGAEFVPPLITVVYFFVLRAIRIRECFRPPLWSLVVIFLVTTAHFALPEFLERQSRGLRDMNDAARIAGTVQVATLVFWAVFLIVGFWRGSREEAEDSV